MNDEANKQNREKAQKFRTGRIPGKRVMDAARLPLQALEERFASRRGPLGSPAAPAVRQVAAVAPAVYSKPRFTDN